MHFLQGGFLYGLWDPQADRQGSSLRAAGRGLNTYSYALHSGDTRSRQMYEIVVVRGLLATI